MEKNKTGKYLKYAIGEIVLVVIGILIALQVNNWNEHRKIQKEISQTINDLEKDLIANYHLANQKLNFYSRSDSMIRLAVYNKFTAEDYKNSQIIRYLTINWDLFTPQTDNIDKFIKSEDILSEDLNPLLNHVKLQKQQETWLNNSWSKFDKIVDDNWKSYSEYSWYGAKDSMALAQEINFKLNDPEYQQKANLYWTVSQNYANNITRYRAKNLATLARIKQIRDTYSHIEMSAFLNDLGMAPFKTLKCDYSINDLDLGRTFRSHELLLNYTKDPVRLVLTYNNGERQDEIILKPSEIRYASSWPFGITGNYNILVELVDKEGNCIKKYGAIHNGYLLIK